jgi:hypothetical protein
MEIGEGLDGSSNPPASLPTILVIFLAEFAGEHLLLKPDV